MHMAVLLSAIKIKISHFYTLSFLAKEIPATFGQEPFNYQKPRTSTPVPPAPAPRLSPNLCNPLKIFAGLSKHLPVFLLGTENVVWGMAIVEVVFGKFCAKMCSKVCSKMCGKTEKLSDWNKNWCGSRYGPHDYDSGDKKTKDKKTKRQKDKKAKRQKHKNTKRQKCKKKKRHKYY